MAKGPYFVAWIQATRPATGSVAEARQIMDAKSLSDANREADEWVRLLPPAGGGFGPWESVMLMETMSVMLAIEWARWEDRKMA